MACLSEEGLSSEVTHFIREGLPDVCTRLANRVREDLHNQLHAQLTELLSAAGKSLEQLPESPASPTLPVPPITCIVQPPAVEAPVSKRPPRPAGALPRGATLCRQGSISSELGSEGGSDEEDFKWSRRHFRTHSAASEIKRQNSESKPHMRKAGSCLSMISHSTRETRIVPANGENCSPVGSRAGSAPPSVGVCVLAKAQALSLKDRAGALVDHLYFEYFTTAAIAVNAFLVGARVQHAAVHGEIPSPAILDVLDLVFCVIFTGELFIRVIADGKDFFRVAGRWWNVFDTFVVGLQLLEMGAQFLAADSSSLRQNSNIGVLRMLRILRVIRVVRLVRVLRLIGELRTIVICIGGSLRSLGWTIFLLLLLIYVTAVYLTQVVYEHTLTNSIEEGPRDLPQVDTDRLQRYYGSLFLSMMTLYEAVSGGINWGVAVTPLMEQINPMLGILFAFYIAFSLLAIMNVVTGTFVESAMQIARRDQDIYMIHCVGNLFSKTDVDGDGVITWDEFQGQLNSPEMQATLKLIDIDVGEARELFQLLDIEEQGMVTFDDFVNGCIRLRGSAKSIDLMTVMYEHRRLSRRCIAQLRSIEAAVQALQPAPGKRPAGTVPAAHAPQASQAVGEGPLGAPGRGGA